MPEVLSFLVAQAGLDAHAAYSTFNMGSGYAIYCAKGRRADVVAIAEGLGLMRSWPDAWRKGPAR